MKPISVASSESGVGIETIRYYEREGIVPLAKRSENGRRYYANEDVSRLRFVKQCRSLGFSIADIRNLQELAYNCENTCEEAAEIGVRNLQSVRLKIAELRRMESALEALVSECQKRPARCPMLEGLMNT